MLVGRPKAKRQRTDDRMWWTWGTQFLIAGMYFAIAGLLVTCLIVLFFSTNGSSRLREGVHVLPMDHESKAWDLHKVVSTDLVSTRRIVSWQDKTSNLGQMYWQQANNASTKGRFADPSKEMALNIGEVGHDLTTQVNMQHLTTSSPFWNGPRVPSFSRLHWDTQWFACPHLSGTSEFEAWATSAAVVDDRKKGDQMDVKARKPFADVSMMYSDLGTQVKMCYMSRSPSYISSQELVHFNDHAYTHSLAGGVNVLLILLFLCMFYILFSFNVMDVMNSILQPTATKAQGTLSASDMTKWDNILKEMINYLMSMMERVLIMMHYYDGYEGLFVCIVMPALVLITYIVKVVTAHSIHTEYLGSVQNDDTAKLEDLHVKFEITQLRMLWCSKINFALMVVLLAYFVMRTFNRTFDLNFHKVSHMRDLHKLRLGDLNVSYLAVFIPLTVALDVVYKTNTIDEADFALALTGAFSLGFLFYILVHIISLIQTVRITRHVQWSFAAISLVFCAAVFSSLLFCNNYRRLEISTPGSFLLWGIVLLAWTVWTNVAIYMLCKSLNTYDYDSNAPQTNNLIDFMANEQSDVAYGAGLGAMKATPTKIALDLQKEHYFNLRHSYMTSVFVLILIFCNIFYALHLGFKDPYIGTRLLPRENLPLYEYFDNIQQSENSDRFTATERATVQIATVSWMDRLNVKTHRVHCGNNNVDMMCSFFMRDWNDLTDSQLCGTKRMQTYAAALV